MLREDDTLRLVLTFNEFKIFIEFCENNVIQNRIMMRFLMTVFLLNKHECIISYIILFSKNIMVI